MPTKLIVSCVLMGLLFSCQANLKVTSFVKRYTSCPDSVITYYSGEAWHGLKHINTQSYVWGFDSTMISGTTTYYKKKGIGKGSIIKLNNENWVVSKITHKNPAASKGNPNPIPETYDVKLFLLKICE